MRVVILVILLLECTESSKREERSHLGLQSFVPRTLRDIRPSRFSLRSTSLLRERFSFQLFISPFRTCSLPSIKHLFSEPALFLALLSPTQYLYLFSLNLFYSTHSLFSLFLFLLFPVRRILHVCSRYPDITQIASRGPSFFSFCIRARSLYTSSLIFCTQRSLLTMSKLWL